MRIGVPPFINVLPLCRYLPFPLVYASPVELQRMMDEGELDCALLPSFGLLKNNRYHAYPEAGIIQSDGPVESVCLFYDRKLSDPCKISSIELSCKSVTSNTLFHVIYSYEWKENFGSLHQGGDHPDGVIRIGDDALFFDQNGYRTCDLGKVWHEWTGLPFVYALWVSREPLPAKMIDALIRAKNEGLGKIEEIITSLHDLPVKRMRHYLTKSISYEMKPKSLEGLKLFQEYCFKLGLLKEKRSL